MIAFATPARLPEDARDRASSTTTALRLATLAEDSLKLELETWPKPGLVSHIDSGSHTDMDAETISRSATALRPYFLELAEAGARQAAMPALRKIGLRAERAMLEATDGINTHRGAIFGLGLLCAAAGLRETGYAHRLTPLGELVSGAWGSDIMIGPRLSGSHGEAASRRYGAGGARWEAVQGFPSVYRVGLPALRQANTLAPGDAEAARLQACFALIATVNDTNLLHRGGAEGLHFAQQKAKRFLELGGVGRPNWRRTALAIHLAFIERRLSPGGAADLLAMSLFAEQLEREPAPW
jgi:triphosphoribosyl-dephospho-CoA synthase